MAKFSADPDLLDRIASELDRIAADMETQSRNLAVAGEQTAMTWKSRYAGQYIDSVSKTRGRISSSSGNVRSAASALRRIAAEVRRAEREIQSKNSGRR